MQLDLDNEAYNALRALHGSLPETDVKRADNIIADHPSMWMTLYGGIMPADFDDDELTRRCESGIMEIRDHWRSRKWSR